jgi:hypothetical protein
MRGLFTDGYNSLWHIIFGMMTLYFPYIFIFYILYQYNDPNDSNLVIDILEYLIGLLVILGFYYGKK